MKTRTLLLSMLLLSVSLVSVVVLIGCAASVPVMTGTAPPLSGAASAYAGGKGGALQRQVAPAPSEELWVISKPEAQQPADEQTAKLPGSGALMAKMPDRSEPVAIPLKHTDVQTHITGYIATVDVTQQYHNPYDGKIEAVYVFPLPANAAVNEFLMTIGERRIRGIIREREEAEKIYAGAKRQGYVASLLTQERPNIFTQSVANIEPGKAIDINIKFFHTLEYVDGWFEYVFPMVVGPRFNPPGYSEGIGAVGRGDRGKSGLPVEIQYLRPEARSGHDISVHVSIDAGVKVEQVESRNHKIEMSRPEEGLVKVALHPTETIPNKDFVLRYQVAGDTVKTALMTHRDERGGFFTLMIIPPDSMRDLPRQPLELVFTLDVSGSMSGPPIEQSRNAIRYALTHMRPDDMFQVIRFAGASERMSERPLPATPANIRRGLSYIEEMQAGGGTMMLEGIKESLNFPGDESRLRFVSLLTDGYIGNEVEILREVHHSRGNARVFGFGVGSSPNRYLLDGVARLGAGVVAYIGLSDPADAVMRDFFERISHPALVDVTVDWGKMQVSEVYPQRIPDLFVGRPVILTGRFEGKEPTTIRVHGKVGGQAHDLEIPVTPQDSAGKHGGITSVWARMRIADLSDEMHWQLDGNYPHMIKQVALDYGLMSAYTAFVAVDSSTRTSGAHGTTVAVPVPVPDGVRYDTTVPE